MQLVKPSFKILDLTWQSAPAMLQRIEEAGRTCYNSSSKITPTSAADFVRMVIKRGHESVIEHVSLSVRFVVDRGVTHEMVRHRLASYSQRSTRYCNESEGGVTFVIPPWCDRIIEGAYRCYKDFTDIEGHLPDDQRCWINAVVGAEAAYVELLNRNWSPQQARSVLPNSLRTEIVMTANLREWRHVLRLRCDKAAHPQMREVMIPLRNKMIELLPPVFEDLKDG